MHAAIRDHTREYKGAHQLFAAYTFCCLLPRCKPSDVAVIVRCCHGACKIKTVQDA